VNLAIAFHEWLKKRRKALDLTVDALADQIACSPNTLRKLESGERRPSQQLAERLAVSLAVPTSDLADFLRYARTGITDQAPAALIPGLPQIKNAHYSVNKALTRLIGQVELIRHLESLLAQRTRLLTLCGPGGVGKTRMAQELASEQQGNYRQGAAWVALANYREPQTALQAIAQTLGIAIEPTETPIEALCQSLAPYELLLVLDNLEQVITIGPHISQLLSACPQLQIIATSRIPLNIRGEHQVAVPTLRLPDQHEHLGLEQAQANPAIALFCERAQAIDANFRLSSENMPSIVAICQQLDGLPLAIELASRRLRLFTPAQLLQRLDKRLNLLVGGANDLPQRQQTLRNTIAWSSELLRDQERRLFADLTVFAGGATIEAIEAVCGNESEPLLDTLQTLVEQHLVLQRVTADQLRFDMLAMIHEFASELLAADQQARLRLRHAQWCYAFLAEPAQIEQIEYEQANIRAALEWLLSDAQASSARLAVQILWHMQQFWYKRTYLNEGMYWLERALPRLEQLDALQQAELLYSAGLIANEAQQIGRAKDLLEQAEPIARALAHTPLLAACLALLSSVCQQHGQAERAEQLAAESVELYRQLDDPQGLCDALDRLAQCAYYRNDLEKAISLQSQVLGLRRQQRNHWLLASALNNLGVAIHENGDAQRALPFIAEAVALQKLLGNQVMRARMQVNLGGVYASLKQYTEAAQCYAESLENIWVLRDMFTITWLLRVIGILLVDDQPVLASRLFAKVEQMMQAQQWQLPHFDQEYYDQALANLRQRISAAELRAAWQIGRHEELEDLVALAIEYARRLAETQDMPNA
jgi:predicted ATPase/DNA-binding XRE family transcriptional regulator